jgi:sulfate transport system ATP-binding protein
MSITLRGVTKQFGEFAAVDDVNLDIPSGALLALLGPSGCGKTTLLRIIAGLETPESGQVLFDGRDATLWPIRDRKVGFVFQNYALLSRSGSRSRRGASARRPPRSAGKCSRCST